MPNCCYFLVLQLCQRVVCFSLTAAWKCNWVSQRNFLISWSSTPGFWRHPQTSVPASLSCLISLRYICITKTESFIHLLDAIGKGKVVKVMTSKLLEHKDNKHLMVHYHQKSFWQLLKQNTRNQVFLKSTFYFIPNINNTFFIPYLILRTFFKYVAQGWAKSLAHWPHWVLKFDS